MWVLSVRGGFRPQDLSEVGFVLKVTAVDHLSEATRRTLERRGLDLATAALDRVHPHRGRRTPYALLGDVVAWASVLAVVIGGGMLGLSALRRRARAAQGP